MQKSSNLIRSNCGETNAISFFLYNVALRACSSCPFVGVTSSRSPNAAACR